MAVLLNVKTQQRIVLRANHTFGRDKQSNTSVLRNPSISRNHANILWDENTWKIKDSSRNGTYVNQCRLKTGAFHPLPLGAKIQFGGQPPEHWQLLDLEPPTTSLLPLNPELPTIRLHDVAVLPLDNEEIIIYASENGSWHCHENGESRPLKNEDKVGRGNKLWRFVEAISAPATAAINREKNNQEFSFAFDVSKNEEHVSLTVSSQGCDYNLQERSHHYLLLILARQRITDISSGLHERDQGWIKKDLFIQMLGMGEQHINIQVHRFRKQISKVFPETLVLENIIERRPGELRFPFSAITITGGFKLAVNST